MWLLFLNTTCMIEIKGFMSQYLELIFRKWHMFKIEIQQYHVFLFQQQEFVLGRSCARCIICRYYLWYMICLMAWMIIRACNAPCYGICTFKNTSESFYVTDVKFAKTNFAKDVFLLLKTKGLIYGPTHWKSHEANTNILKLSRLVSF